MLGRFVVSDDQLLECGPLVTNHLRERLMHLSAHSDFAMPEQDRSARSGCTGQGDRAPPVRTEQDSLRDNNGIVHSRSTGFSLRATRQVTGVSQSTVHIRQITLTGKHNNNKMERLNGEIRDREKVMRGLKRDGTPILTGYQIYHNYVRPHEALDGRIPADKCGIKIEGKDKWLTLIQNASRIRKELQD